ncbi:MAG TPA: 8-oxo-dGTP diphosphatase [Sphaerochaeta sp.]|nr:8-oxo-dGTP diphosphatase [Sphaerochaeta sp.]
MFLSTINRYITWALIAILALNLAQRRLPNSHKKRLATIYLAALVLFFQLAITTILDREWNHHLAWLALLATLGLLYLFRKRALPFRFSCSACERRLTFNEIIGGDENLCAGCRGDEEEGKEGAPKDALVDDAENAAAVMDVALIDWESWEPTDICVITFLFADDKVLLIDKKTGLGKGLVNAPGGHVEPYETAEEAAMREFVEETGITVDELSLRGMLYFQFADGMRQKGYVFFTTSYAGEMQETEEARPFWVPIADIPYDKMWEDDQYWLPKAIAGERFTGHFSFDKERMVDKDIIFEEEA